MRLLGRREPDMGCGVGMGVVRKLEDIPREDWPALRHEFERNAARYDRAAAEADRTVAACEETVRRNAERAAKERRKAETARTAAARNRQFLYRLDIAGGANVQQALARAEARRNTEVSSATT